MAPACAASSAPDDPDTTAQVVYQAYTLGDRDCAGNLATAEAVDQLFSIPGGGGGWELRRAASTRRSRTRTPLCSFTFEGGSTSFRMDYSDTEGWTVYEVFQTAD